MAEAVMAASGSHHVGHHLHHEDGDGEGPHRHHDPRALFISNLHYAVTDVQLGDAFEHEGIPIHDVEIIKKGIGATKKGSGYAVVTLENEDDKEKSMEVMAGKNLFGFEMVVRDDKFVEVLQGVVVSEE